MLNYSKRSFNKQQSSGGETNFPTMSAYRRSQMHYSFTQTRFGGPFPSQVSDYNPSRSGQLCRFISHARAALAQRREPNLSSVQQMPATGTAAVHKVYSTVRHPCHCTLEPMPATM